MILLAPQTIEQFLAHTQGQSQGGGSLRGFLEIITSGLKARLCCFRLKDPQRVHPSEAIRVPRSQRRGMPSQTGVGSAAAGNYRGFTRLSQIPHVCGQMLAERSWALQSSPSEERGENAKATPGLAGAAAACGRWRRLMVKASCPLLMRFNSSTNPICKEICPAAAQKNALEMAPKLGHAVLMGERYLL